MKTAPTRCLPQPLATGSEVDGALRDSDELSGWYRRNPEVPMESVEKNLMVLAAALTVDTTKG